jgi:catechol 2,3-dioxygenase-like lactoylglutathione lyase family enzyme
MLAQIGDRAMPLSHIEHYLILTHDITAARDWYVDVLGFREGPHPDFPFPVCWLYLGDQDVIHIGQVNASAEQRKYLGDPTKPDGKGTGALDHIAFRATGLPATLAHLRAKNIAFTERQVDDQGLYQLFLHDPHGIKIELNFAAAEATDRRAPVMAADLR